MPERLRRHLAEQQAAVRLFGAQHGVGHQVEERIYNMVARQVDVGHLLAAVDASARHLLAGPVGREQALRQMVDERALEAPGQDVVLGVAEHSHAGAFQRVDNARAQVAYLVVHVGLVVVGAVEALLLLGREKGQEQVFRVAVGKDAQLVGVLDVHDFVADVVGRLDEIDQRMARVDGQPSAALRLGDAQHGGYLLIVGPLGFEKAKLRLGPGQRRTVGILDDGGQRRVGHDEASRPAAFETVGEQAKRVGVAVEMDDVVPFGLRQAVALGHVAGAQGAALALGEVAAYGPLARMAKGRVAHVVGQAGGRHDGPDGAQVALGRSRAATQQFGRHVGAERASHARHLQAMGQAVVDEDAARQGEHLRFVLHAAEGGRKNQPVVIALKLRAPFGQRTAGVLLAQAAGGDELFPFHKSWHIGGRRPLGRGRVQM